MKFIIERKTHNANHIFPYCHSSPKDYYNGKVSYTKDLSLAYRYKNLHELRHMIKTCGTFGDKITIKIIDRESK